MSRFLKKILILATAIAAIDIFIYMIAWLKLNNLKAYITGSAVIKMKNVIVLMIIIDFVFTLLFSANIIVRRRIGRQMQVFEMDSLIRNVDYLIIGENCNPHDIIKNGSNKFVQLIDPGLSERAAFEILRHTHSILKTNGTVALVLKQKHLSSEKIGVMDIIFLHDMTIKEYGLEYISMLRKLIIFLEPIRSIKVLLCCKDTGFEEIGGGTYLQEFCTARELKLSVYVK